MWTGKKDGFLQTYFKPLQEQDLELSDDALSNSGSEPRSLSHSLETSDISDNEGKDNDIIQVYDKLHKITLANFNNLKICLFCFRYRYFFKEFFTT